MRINIKGYGAANEGRKRPPFVFYLRDGVKNAFVQVLLKIPAIFVLLFEMHRRKLFKLVIISKKTKSGKRKHKVSR